MRRYDGGPAFPATWQNDGDMNNSAPDGSTVPPGGFAYLPGMSLRDYFATHAPPYPFKLPMVSVTDDVDPGTKIATAIARWNFDYADAMLAERAK